MKRMLITVVLAVLCGISARAQMLPQMLPQMPPQMSIQADSLSLSMPPSFQDYELYELLSRENTLLRQRKIAFILSLAGTGTAVLGGAMLGGYEQPSSSGITFATLGSMAASAGYIWLIVNEFQFISNRQKINTHLQFRLDPNGLILNF